MFLGRTYLLAFAFLVLSAGGLFAQPKTIRQLVGHVTEKNFPQFEAYVSDNFENIVGLKVFFDKSNSNDKLQAYVYEKQFASYMQGPDARSEFVLNSHYRYEHGGYVIDGFFRVKSGGIHQGIISYALVPVDESKIRLNSSIKVVPLALK